MNELLIIGLLAGALIIACIVAWICEDGAEWLDEKITEHYVRKMYRQRRKARKAR